MFYILTGFAGGCLIAQLIRFLAGKIICCASCGQRQWVAPGLSGPVCCRCHTALNRTESKAAPETLRTA
ncbi:hypothetical protein A6M21_01750 [Desulfotomaculum copahuensis]|uniref:Uncharacterized protein n=1 Tax=Desulfotomaculum copahuensis TaxID=1838280 RepID=A0A1B7LKF0_9FIRM|nr:hypothetical protein A6M21_01750 [Desulfotomaculum copahuensis]